MEYLKLFLTLASILSACGIGAAVVIGALHLASKVTKTDFLSGKPRTNGEIDSDGLRRKIRELEARNEELLERNEKNETAILRLNDEVSYYRKLLDTEKKPGRRS